jgi:hypothetical protein
MQYNYIPDSSFTLESLRGVKALLLPNAALISDQHMDVMREYVKAGGGLIASYNTSLFDEKGCRRSDFGLKDLFGASFTGKYLDTMNDSYQLIENKKSPVLAFTGDTDMLQNSGHTLLCTKVDQNYDTVSTYIPTIANQPPEYAWIPSMKTDYPVITSGKYGKGRVVYFANQTDALCFTHGHEDFTEIYKNSIDYVTNADYSLTSNAPRSVHINMIADQTNRSRVVVAMVNTTGTSQRPMKELVPVYDIIIRIPLQNKTLQHSSVLWGKDIEVSTDCDFAIISVKRLDEFASVELRLSYDRGT